MIVIIISVLYRHVIKVPTTSVMPVDERQVEMKNCDDDIVETYTPDVDYVILVSDTDDEREKILEDVHEIQTYKLIQRINSEKHIQEHMVTDNVNFTTWNQPKNIWNRDHIS